VTFDEKVLSPEQIAKLRALALQLIEHPKDLLDACRRGEVADLLGMAVAFADEVMAAPAELPAGLQQDPEIRNGIMDEMCRLWIEDGQRIPAAFLPWVAVGFRELNAVVRQAYQSERAEGARQRRGVYAVGRMMVVLIEDLGWPPSEAARTIGKAARISAESALREYHRYRTEGK
jgi:hypothetical protein